jgi:hypothetical protein
VPHAHAANACCTCAPAQQLKFPFCYSITWGQQLPGLLTPGPVLARPKLAAAFLFFYFF